MFKFSSLVLLSVLAFGVAAQTYPSKPIRLVVGFPPGGSNDIVARIIAPKLTQLLGAQVVVENRPGANATIGTDYVAKSAPDGYTIVLGSASPLVISPFTFSNIPYDTVRDFAGITTIASTPEMMAIHPSLPARNLKELLALARSQPGKLNFASSGNGGLPHLATELFKKLGKVNVVHVPYKGAGPAAVDLVGGHVHGMIIDMPALAPFVKSGKLRGIAITAEKRTPLLPDLPTSAEAGMPGLIAVNWFAIMAPAKTPKPVVDKLYGALAQAVNAADVKEQLRAQGVDTYLQSSTDAFTAFLRAELGKWEKVARESGARAD
ncbi:MAG TPA: tripartite tricarboxylate transporter substrate binding protein [Burkholderiales bacterium]|nr:tripartite tricarboxylate transporter substrate binding protein [Burkholderiales bacterium]